LPSAFFHSGIHGQCVTFFGSKILGEVAMTSFRPVYGLFVAAGLFTVFAEFGLFAAKPVDLKVGGIDKCNCSDRTYEICKKHKDATEECDGGAQETGCQTLSGNVKDNLLLQTFHYLCKEDNCANTNVNEFANECEEVDPDGPGQ
jgi:hypothetical protein